MSTTATTHIPPTGEGPDLTPIALSDPAPRPPGTPGAPRIDVPGLETFLLGRWADLRREARTLGADPRFTRIEGQTPAEHRARILDQLRLLVTEGQVLRAFPERLGGSDDPGGNIAGFEELITADPLAPPTSRTASCRAPWTYPFPGRSR